MSNSMKALIVIVILAIIGGGGYAAWHSKQSTSSAKSSMSTTQSSSNTAPSTMNPAPQTPPANTQPTNTNTNPASFSVHANDNGADRETISVSKGQAVQLTFNVDQGGVYHGGLQFVSTDPSLDTGPIDPGEAKTVSFTANKSFSFTPYWYANHVQKDYQIQVSVQ